MHYVTSTRLSYSIEQSVVWPQTSSKTMGLHVLETDSSMHVRGDILFTVYVNDILIAGPSIQARNAAATELSRTLEVVNRGEVKGFSASMLSKIMKGTRTRSVNIVSSIDHLQNSI